MATRMFLHHALSSVSGTLPNSEQSSKAINFNYDAQSVNRSMDTTIGTSQATLSFISNQVRNDEFGYVTKFISPNLNQTGLAANTWSWNYAAKISAGGPINAYPTPSTSDNMPICVYVWRPSTGAKVANIFDGNTSTTGYDVGFENNLNEVVEKGTFSGAAVAGTAVNDVIVVEMWVRLDAVNTTSTTCSVFYDGTTVNTGASGTTVSNHASFLETPENLTFVAGGAPIDMTQVAAKTYSNKFITKV
jgi:hypothetical protein